MFAAVLARSGGRPWGHRSVLLILTTCLLLAAAALSIQTSVARGAPFRRGDLFLTGAGLASASATSIKEYSPTGQVRQALSGTVGAEGICFDPSSAHLILLGVGLFDASGNKLPSNWGSVTGARCVADSSGHVYVSGTGTALKKYDLQGSLLQSYNLPFVGSGIGPMAIALGPDQCSVYYGMFNEVSTPSNGIARFNVCTGTAEPGFSSYGFTDDLRVLRDGEVLVTTDTGALLFNATGAQVRTYFPGIPVSNRLRWMSFDPDGTSFWMAGIGGVVRYDIRSGALLAELGWGATPPIASGPIAVLGGQAPLSGGTIPIGSSPPTKPAHGGPLPPSLAQVRARLRAILIPHGRQAKLGRLLASGGYTLSFSAPSAGRLVVSWFGHARCAARVRCRTVLIATVSRRFRRARTVRVKVLLTRRGGRLLRSRRRVGLTAKGSFVSRGRPPAYAVRHLTLTR